MTASSIEYTRIQNATLWLTVTVAGKSLRTFVDDSIIVLCIITREAQHDSVSWKVGQQHSLSELSPWHGRYCFGTIEPTAATAVNEVPVDAENTHYWKLLSLNVTRTLYRDLQSDTALPRATNHCNSASTHEGLSWVNRALNIGGKMPNFELFPHRFPCPIVYHRDLSMDCTFKILLHFEFNSIAGLLS